MALDPHDLSEASLLAAAREATGLTDFGDESFREGLRVLLETYETTANLSEGGRKRTQRRLLMLLATRLKIEAAFERHPEIREIEIRRPLYVTGLPRSGTSALFNLLAEDPTHRPLLLWEGLFPDPLEDLEPGQTDPRLAAVRAMNERDRKRNPDFDKIHYVTADMPEECVMLQAHTFCDVQLGIEPLMEPYASWFRRQDLRPAYAYYADLLRMLQWQRPGERWLLKSPAHLWALDILPEMFPDVGIVWTHRDPVPLLASYSSMMAMMMSVRESFDPKELGPTVLDYLAVKVEHALAARDGADASRFVDVDYREFLADPLKTARNIYDVLDLELPPESETALRDHVEKNPQNRHGKHTYTLEEYGLTPEAVRERLAGYLERFALD
ncbi:MAG: sulfotransferase [Myxococcales bacterium]|nr:sulfotransferase [Myxococcales bacterium]